MSDIVSASNHTPAVASDDPILAALMRAATDKDFDVQKFEAVMFAIERREKVLMLRSFNRDKAAAQAQMVAVKKDGKNAYLTTKYSTLDAMLQVVLPACADHRIGVSFTDQPATQPGWKAIACVITHDDGHVEMVAQECPILATTGTRGGQTQMNNVQATLATSTYLKRYTLGMAFALIQQDEPDTDGEPIGGRGGGKQPSASPPADVDPATGKVKGEAPPDISKGVAKYPGFATQLWKIPSTERLDIFKANPKFTAWWDGEAKIARINGNLIDDMIYHRRLELEAAARAASEAAVAEARAKAAAAQGAVGKMLSDFERGEVRRSAEQAEQGEPSTDFPDDEDPPGQSAELTAMLAEIAALKDLKALDDLLHDDRWAKRGMALSFGEQDTLEAGFKARAAELEGKV